MSARTQRTYLSYLHNHIRPRMDTLLMSHVSTNCCDLLIKQNLDAHGYYSAKTVRTILSGICGLAVSHRVMEANPAQRTTPLAAWSPKSQHPD